MKLIVIFCIVFVVIYTIWAAVEFHFKGLEPGALTAAVYAFFGTELAALCVKRIFDKHDEQQRLKREREEQKRMEKTREEFK